MLVESQQYMYNEPLSPSKKFAHSKINSELNDAQYTDCITIMSFIAPEKAYDITC